MKQHLRKRRDKIIKKEWEENLKLPYPLSSTDFFKEILEIFNSPPSVPSFYRIIKDKNVPIIGKIVPDKKLGNKVIFKGRKLNNK